ncbi:UPF0187 protein [Flagellimonas maritima]|uniref:UPF0187 protein n=1 Tax=Flagellimonas maritima TaxID=1383885 RepID=A0A2Z4LRE7_9FLAO|nr:bestrophin family ion channel [Allomuricauda aurantiaca]AWX44403.1 UPF0187 protein [Allomuricauda aurantiaca]
MYTGKSFSLKEVLIWTRRDILKFLVIATIPTAIYALLDWKWMVIPWLPVALIGTAVAFLIGFKNNATYDRMWEARKIWGMIVNTSRSWGIMSKDFISDLHSEEKVDAKTLIKIQTQLIYRHLAWVTCLRYQLRVPKEWENLDKNYNAEYRKKYVIHEFENSLEAELKPLLEAAELRYILSKKNRATQLIANQSKALKELRKRGLTDDFRHMEMEALLLDVYSHQGKSERIKNFPYPRQFATLNLFFVWLFILLVPFGLMKEFDVLGANFVWMTIPFSLLVSWVFHTMEKIGEITENPFEGSPNDIPMAALSRTIEIDLRDMLDEENLPEPIAATNHILM